MKVPIVTIVGKPNVGKSTLFNRIIGLKKAITAEEEGTTRDRIFHIVEGREMDYFLVDTGGLEFEKRAPSKVEGKSEHIEDNIQEQARVAIEESDLILFMVSSREDFTKKDFKAAELLRKTTGKKPIILVANKCDHPLDESALAHMYSLGLGEPFQTSAIHNTGLEKLQSEILNKLKERHFLTKKSAEYTKVMKFDESHLNVALVGKPNVGKSSIINALLNQEKLIVSNIPGTTRDSTDSLIRHEGKDFNFIDTAGMRRRGKISTGVEHFSVLRTLSSIQRCDVALLVIDTSSPISHQDQQTANTILKANKGLVILANKWDIKEDDEESDSAEAKADASSKPEEKRRAKFLGHLKRKFTFLPWVSVIFTSAVTKKNLSKIFDQLELIKIEREKRISTSRLNHFVDEVVHKHRPTGTKRIDPKVFYITQVDTKPPHFVFFVNKKKYFHFSYLRYLENQIRDRFGFNGTSIVMEYREKEKRYTGKK